MLNLIRNQGNAFSDLNKRHFRWVKFKNPTLPNVVKDVKQQELGVLTGSTTLKNNFELLVKNVFTFRPSNPLLGNSYSRTQRDMCKKIHSRTVCNSRSLEINSLNRKSPKSPST